MKHAVVFFASLLASIPVVGFIYGVLNCEECHESAINYLIVGVANAIFAIFGAGYLYVDQMRSINGWPYILPVGIVFYILTVLVMRMRGSAAEQ